MKMITVRIAGLALAGAAVALQVDPTKPMVTGRGNVSVHPARTIVTNQTTPTTEAPQVLEKFVVTGSLIMAPARQANPKK